MDPRLSMRVLLLFVVFGHHVMANVYRYSGGRRVQPYMEQASPRSHKPASSYESYIKPSGSSESSRPSQGPSGAYGRQVDGYSRQGSVSNYRPASAVSKFRQTSQQPPNVHLTSDEGRRFGSGTVSSGAIEIRDTIKPSRQPSGPKSAVLQSKAGMWNLPSKPSGGSSGNVLSHVSEVYSSKPSQEGPESDPNIKWDASLASRPSSHNLNKQMPGSKPVASRYYSIRPQSSQLTSRPTVQRHRSSPAKPQQQSASSGGHILQSKAGMWDLPRPFGGESQRLGGAHRATEMYTTPKPYQTQPLSLTARVQQIRAGMRDNAPASSRRMDVEVQNPKRVPVASLYNYEGQRPQLRSMHNRNRQSAH